MVTQDIASGREPNGAAPGGSTPSFPTAESERARQCGQKLLGLIARTMEWSAIPNSPGIDATSLRSWQRKVRLLTRSASRPPALGVFGESQVGKSYLISCFSGTGHNDILVRDPQFARSGRMDADKPWSKEQGIPPGGIPFLSYINTDAKGESTGIICRFTRYPVDQPLNDDTFVGRVLSHTDLLLSLAIGYLMEVEASEDPTSIHQMAEVELKAIAAAPQTPVGNGDEITDLESAWHILRNSYKQRASVSALEKAGFDDQIKSYAASQSRPTGEAWFRLAGLLWNGAVMQGLTRLYRTLYESLREADFPSIIEIPSRVVCPPADGSLPPITDVRLLDQLFKDTATVPVAWRKEGQTQNRAALLTRSAISALLSELTLPLAGAAGADRSSLLEVADVLDFPGARAPTRSQKEKVEDPLVAEQNAMLAFRRGKLTRLFGLLTEEREITALCLAAAGGQNVEASGIVRTLLDDWLKSQREGEDELAETANPALFLAITKSDVLVTPTPSIAATACPLGQSLSTLRKMYSAQAENEGNWMDRWGRGNGRFKDVHWVYNVHMFRISNKTEGDRRHLAQRMAHLLADPTVRDYVSDPQMKWEDLLATGGVGLLSRRIADRLRNTDKFRRLRVEFTKVARDLAGRLRSVFRSGDDAADQAVARADARQLVNALRSRFQPDGVNTLSELLQLLRIDTGLVSRLLDRMDREAGNVDEEGHPTVMSFDRFFNELQKVWATSLTDRLEADYFSRRLGVEIEAMQGVGRHWRDLPRQPWMRRALQEVLEPYFDNPQGPYEFRLTMASAACWVWNRRMVELDEPVEDPKPVARPPAMSPRNQPPWFWILDHWEKRLPEVYVRNVSEEGPPPPGNEVVGAILKDLAPLESVGGGNELEAANASR